MPRTLGLSLALLVASSAAMAKQNHPTSQNAAPSYKAKSASPAKARSAKKPSAAKRAGARREKTAQRSRSTAWHPAPAADQYIGALRAAAAGQVGRAAWYGNQHIGRPTASGEPLDTVNATAAHRSLPLHSLVRVTNLDNGRSVVVRINDRGPFKPSVMIDMSPRAAAAIDMINAGIVNVMIEPMAFAGGVGDSAR